MTQNNLDGFKDASIDRVSILLYFYYTYIRWKVSKDFLKRECQMCSQVGVTPRLIKKEDMKNFSMTFYFFDGDNQYQIFQNFFST